MRKNMREIEREMEVWIENVVRVFGGCCWGSWIRRAGLGEGGRGGREEEVKKH